MLHPTERVTIGHVESVQNTAGEDEILCRLWVHGSTNVLDQAADDLELILTNPLDELPIALTGQWKQIAEVNAWTLLELKTIVPAHVLEYFAANNVRSRGPGRLLEVSFKNNGAEEMWLDDIRVQPSEAEMTAYVYDPVNFRLRASFDSQHFGLYYQYNEEGQLIRKLIETERGVKTISETNYNSPSVDRVKN